MMRFVYLEEAKKINKEVKPQEKILRDVIL